MKVNKSDLLRVLKVVKSVDVNEVVFDSKGLFRVSSGDVCYLFGNGISFERPVGIMDISMLQKMLEAMSDAEVDIVFDKKEDVMVISGKGDLYFGYRLGDVNLIDQCEDIRKHTVVRYIKQEGFIPDEGLRKD